MSYKGQLSDINTHRPEFAGVFAALQSAEFRQMLSRISGIPELLEDPILAGGGLHLSPKSGFLDVHVDANFHPYDKTLHRRLNLLIYLNPEWNAAWGGDFELWSDRRRRPHRQAKAVAPLFNRAMLFSTTRTSWHGVQAIDCPPGQARRSIALYYYTKERPPEEEYQDSSVIWYQPRSALKSALYPVMNFCIALLKPYAKYLRRGVFDAARRK
jgi:Rps23 Pro-64 3,4-dihydroxylase Tpa1-like proline 4-hydroxylase